MNDRLPPVSVIVPTFNREQELCDTLRGLLQQDYPELEIIIVDQSERHERETESFLRGLPPRAHWHPLRPPSLPLALNSGVERARGEIVIFTDDDVLIEDGSFIRAHAKNYEDPEVGGVAGRIWHEGQTESRTDDPRYARARLPWLYMRFDVDGRREVYMGAGANLSFRRVLVKRAGGFDPRFVGEAFRSDADLCFRVRRLGYRIWFDPEAALIHRYKTPGGAGNIHFMGRSPASHPYYRFFFRNNFYFALKHLRGLELASFTSHLYREHTLNRAYLREGAGFLLRRHLTLLRGLLDGLATWLEWRLRG